MLDAVIHVSDRMLFTIGVGLTAIVALGALLLVLGSMGDESRR